MDIKRTPLHAEHLALGAKMVEFAGWEMPVQYEGVIQESLAVRRTAGMFDVSHMARLHFRGPAAFEYLEQMTANDVSKLVDGASQYSLLCYPDGGCVDDIILYRIGPEWFRMVVNAANHEKDVAWLTNHLRDGVSLEDETERTAMIAVQGPNAVPIVNRLAGEDLSEMSKFTGREFHIAGRAVFGARTGYTGEDGFELILGAEDASVVWRALLDAEVKPCGLAARDVLRLEAGLPLYGHELTKDINPIEAGLGWVVSKTKSFIGSESI
ncbi:MAG: glycine cleavage system aminomethyltransferase GcvT, partial [Fimbriimonadia bacterium]